MEDKENRSGQWSVAVVSGQSQWSVVSRSGQSQSQLAEKRSSKCLEFEVPKVRRTKTVEKRRSSVKIFYPYWAGASKWEELRYSLRSLEKNFKEDFVVYLVGDCPDFLRQAQEPKTGEWRRENGEQESDQSQFTENVVHIPYKRDDTRSGLWNTTRMMEVFMKEANFTNQDEFHESGDLFVRMNDDVYLIGERTLEDLMVTRIVRMPEEVAAIRSGSATWRRQVLSTHEELINREYPGYMTESHCPEVFSGRLMNLIYQAFTLPESELLPSTLYYNVFPYQHQLLDRKTERALFYGEENAFSYSSDRVAKKCRDKYFLNHNDSGLNEELKRFIEDMFSEKSRFEK